MTITFWSVGIYQTRDYQTRDIDLKGPFLAVDKVENQSTGWCPEDSLPVANRKNESDSVLQECREQQRGGTEKIPQAKIRQRGGRQKPRYPSRGRIPSIFTNRQPTTIKRMIIILLFLFCVLGVEGSSSQMGTDCRDIMTNCSQYSNNQYCEPDHDHDEHVNVTWLFLNCQKTCICSQLKDNATEDTDPKCKDFQHFLQCLQRPPAEEFRNTCPKTCFYSATPNFLTSPKNQTIKEGSNLTLECSINSTSPPVNITWVKNGKPIVPGKRGLVSSNSTTSMLTIIAASPSDQGRYYCNATNNNYQQLLQSQTGYVTNEEGGPKKATNDNTGLTIGITGGLLAISVVVVLVVLVVLKVLKLRKLRSHKKAEDDEVKTDLNSSD
ncbi:uncharacterized protein LOC124131551 isoform X1 [Haliotis rufescens]|uniref:uncharacterized protein LOC124131551 isoform X1 n=1 Tax=Haliotis rufescens TaxID=6454 RepID=UPI00201F9B37|nr:uncharacterized protein LOC124131551 isoform X1 [Haliotis rufescens]